MATGQHFTAGELACHHCGRNFATPELVAALEQLRALLPPLNKGARPLGISDACRCPDWNSHTPNAATHSQHLDGTAADVFAPGLSAAELQALALQVPTINGIGRADAQGYLHVDVRKTEARWCYDRAGRVIPYFDPVQPVHGVAV